MTCGLQGDEQNALEGEGVAAVRKNMSSTNYPTNECTRKCLNQSLLVIDQCLNGHQLAAVENTTPCLNISLGVCVTIVPAPRTIRMGETQRGQGSVDKPRPPPPADLHMSGCLKNIYTVWSTGGLSIRSRLEADYLHSSSLTACGTLCGEGSVPLCPSPPLTSSATYWHVYESYSNLALSVRLEERTALKVILFVM